MQKNNLFWLSIIVLGVLVISGCGETVHGVGQDFSRMGRGVKTIFVSGN